MHWPRHLEHRSSVRRVDVFYAVLGGIVHHQLRFVASLFEAQIAEHLDVFGTLEHQTQSNGLHMLWPSVFGVRVHRLLLSNVT